MKRRMAGCLSVAVFVAAAFLAPPLRAADAKIDVNSATEEELKKLPGMNEARAKAIVNYRKNTGELIQLEELKLIPQVKPIYDQIAGRLTVE
ncbi:MAG: Helix-hairpin-helix motif [Candidatus Binatota bacterium]|jgi:competence protein ComEA|nr:Helix-hairpin-helix motif [Candidatus Binatota bacterium]